MQNNKNSASINGDPEEDTSGYLSDTLNNSDSSPDLALERHPERTSQHSQFKPGRIMEANNDFSELQYPSSYSRKPPSSSTFTVDAHSIDSGKRVRQYYEENRNFGIPSGYHNQGTRSVKSRSTFAGDDIDLDLETDFSVPK